MSRFDRRVSRPLIAILAVAVCLGAGSIFYKLNSRPSAAHAEQPAPAQASLPPTGGNGLMADTSSVPHALPSTRPGGISFDESKSAPARVAIESPATQAILASKMEAPTTAPSSTLLIEAKAQIDAGKLLAARQQLNDALQSGQLSEAQAGSVKSMISQISQTLVFSRQHVAADPYGGTYVVQRGESFAKIAAEHDTTWELLSHINGIPPKSLRAGATIKVIQGPFFAVVDKQKFTMDMYLGGLPGEKSSMYVTTYPVGLGRDDSTPVGTWMIEPHRKLKHPTYYSPRGEGVVAADDPKNPLGGFWIGLTGTEGQAVGKLSYGIHGTIDPESIGKQSSMGCIRLRAEDIAQVFDLLVEGKSIVVVKG
ncbi:MAG: L,D-transpeptidase family protein [Planctomycetota bacterium]|nr:L,D-transpeptidase family protein [Planctomycetota bacterium]